MLFNLYIDDLTIELRKALGMKTYLYADDLAVLMIGLRQINRVL